MKKGQYFIIATVIIVMIIVPAILMFKIPTSERITSSTCFFMLENMREGLVNTVDISLEQDENGTTISRNLDNFSYKLEIICNSSSFIRCGLNYSVEKVDTSPEDITLLEEDFEDFTHTSGLDFYEEMGNHSFYVYDYAHPWNDDDVYLEENGSGDYYVCIQDNSYVSALVNTTGYANISITYTRRAYELESWQGDDFRIQWRVGSSGGWTLLEETDDDTWETKTWELSDSANNKELIQVRFLTAGYGDYNTDFGHMDDFLAQGDIMYGENIFNVTLNFTLQCENTYLHDEFTRLL